MTDDGKKQADGLMSDDSGGWMGNFLADEEHIDRYALWRLGSWGVGTIAVVIAGLVAMKSPVALQRDQIAAADIARQSQQVQWIAKESQSQTRQLAAAVETLNSDRDRLYARVTVLEQGMDSVTGSIAKQNATATLPAIPSVPVTTAATPPETKAEVTPPPKIAPVASVAAPQPSSNAKPGEQKSDAVSSTELQEPATTSAVAPAEPVTADKPIKPTEFGVDLGSANSVEGLRALWRGAVKANNAQLASLTPIISVKERTDGLGMQLRLVAGPLNDAAAAAKICATLTISKRACDTSRYEGQRLALQGDKKLDGTTTAPRPRARVKPENPANTKPGSFSSIFGAR